MVVWPFGKVSTPESLGGAHVCRGVTGYWGVCVHVPPGDLGGRVVTVSGGRVHVGGLILHLLARFRPLRTPGVPMYVGGDRVCRAITVYTSPGGPWGEAVCVPLPYSRVLSNRF